MTLKTELENGKHNYFKLVGAVKLTDKSFSGPRTYDGTTWHAVNESIGIDVGSKNVIWPQVSGGYDLTKNTLFKMDTDYKSIQVPVADRHKDEWVKRVAPNQFFRASIVKNGDHLDRKEFLSAIDYAEYLKENLIEGMEVVVTGEASYSLNKDGETVYRNYEIKNIYLNEMEEKEGVMVRKNAPEATLRQTYLIDDSSLDSRYKKDLEANGETVISVHVPQYLGKLYRNGQRIVWKRVTPLRQALVYRADKEDKEKFEKALKWPERLFKVKRDQIREIHLVTRINEGFDVQNAIYDISPALQELIDEGILTEDQVKSQSTIRGARTSELIYVRPHIEKEGETLIPYRDDKYAASVLFQPIFDDEEGEEAADIATDAVENSDVTHLGEEEFESIFGL